MLKQLLYCSLFFYCTLLNAQFKFSGEVTPQFANATAYLTVVDEYQKSNLFITEKIIQECQIDSLNRFTFSGDFLADKNMLYKIYVDTCNDDVSNYKHLLSHCETSQSILFIANNSDNIHFPLNDLSQLFCEITNSSKQNTAVLELNQFQEQLLANLQSSKSDAQRTVIYNNCFQKLQEFSTTFNDPLVELFAFHLYANETSFSRPLYLKDLKHNEYYINLLDRISEIYPNSEYAAQLENDLNKDNYTLLKQKNASTSIFIYVISGLFVLSLLLNFILFRKQKVKKEIPLDYTKLLTPQEQNVFELMHKKHSNKSIAEKLFISVSTVKTHINNIYSKLNISSRKDVDSFFE